MGAETDEFEISDRLGNCPTTPSSDKGSIGIIAGVAVGAVLLIIIFLQVLRRSKRQRVILEVIQKAPSQTDTIIYEQVAGPTLPVRNIDTNPDFEEPHRDYVTPMTLNPMYGGVQTTPSDPMDPSHQWVDDIYRRVSSSTTDQTDPCRENRMHLRCQLDEYVDVDLKSVEQNDLSDEYGDPPPVPQQEPQMDDNPTNPLHRWEGDIYNQASSSTDPTNPSHQWEDNIYKH